MKTITIIFFVTALLFMKIALSQESTGSALFLELKKGDSLIFEEGFNKCNLAALDSIIHIDFEFYHDQNGIQDRATFLKGFKESICSNPKGKPIRKLVEGSLTVYPLKNEGQIYGAIQMGTHNFYMSEPGKELRFSENAKFIATWILVNGMWKVKRELSFDHNNRKRE